MRSGLLATLPSRFDIDNLRLSRAPCQYDAQSLFKFSFLISPYLDLLISDGRAEMTADLMHGRSFHTVDDVPTPQVSAIYAPRGTAQAISPLSRIGAGLIAAACLTVLIIARILSPSPSGVGTHTAMGLQRCEFLDRTGIPCPTCGMTTSFAHFARGNIAASLYVQPMGTVLATLTAATVWIALYTALTGESVLRLLQILPARYYFLPLMFFAVAAWGWKIFIHLRGIDGWR
jgi:hypothetical protein